MKLEITAGVEIPLWQAAGLLFAATTATKWAYQWLFVRRNLCKETVLITGASSGIGKAAAEALVKRGATVVLVARSQSVLNAMAATLGKRAVACPADASDKEAVIKVARDLEQRGIRVTTVVNCAGVGEWLPIEEYTVEQTKQTFGAPMLAALNITQVFLPALREAALNPSGNRDAVIVHVNSPVAFAPWSGTAVYGMARWGLRGLHECLTMELWGERVRSSHLVLWETTSPYFDNNPSAKNRVPKIAKLMCPAMSPEKAALGVVRAVEYGERDQWYPFMAHVTYLLWLWCPSLVEWLTHITTPK